jgi:hypothetical protein
MPRDGCEACGKAKLTASRTALGAFRQRLQASHCSQHLLTKLSQPTAAFSREIGYGTLRSSVVPSSTSISTQLTSSCPAQHKGRSTLRGDWRWQWQARVLVEQRKHSRRVSSFSQLDLTWWHLSSCGHVHGIHSRRGLGLLGGSCSGLGCPHLLRLQCPLPAACRRLGGRPDTGSALALAHRLLALCVVRAPSPAHVMMRSTRHTIQPDMRIRAAGRCHYTALHRGSLSCTHNVFDFEGPGYRLAGVRRGRVKCLSTACTCTPRVRFSQCERRYVLHRSESKSMQQGMHSRAGPHLDGWCLACVRTPCSR